MLVRPQTHKASLVGMQVRAQARGDRMHEQSTRGGRQEGRAPRVMTSGLARQEHRAKLVKVRVS